MLKLNILKLLRLDKTVYILSILFTLIIAGFFFSSMDIEGNTKTDGVEYHEIDHPWNSGSVYHFYNSDALWMATLSNGILYDHYFKGWNLGTCPNIFPGLFIMMILNLFIKNFALIQLANGFIQIILLIILLNYLYKEIYSKISYYSLSISNILLSLYLIWPLYYRDTIISLNIFLPFHFGAFLSAILALILFYKYYKTTNTKYLILYIITLVLSSLSNNIFLIFYGIPIAFTLLLLLLTKNYKTIFILFGATVLSILTGWLLYRGLVLFDIFDITELPSFSENTKQSFFNALNQIESFIVEGSIFRRLVFILSFISVIISVIIAGAIIVKHIRIWFTSNYITHITNIEIFIIFFSGMFLCSLAAPIKLGIYFSIAEIRYCIFGIFLGITNIAFFLDIILNKRPNWLAFISISSTIIILIFIVINYNTYKPLSIASKIKDYYPGVTKAVDDLSLKYNLKNGAGFHWDTKHVTCLSRYENKVNSTYSGLYLRHFGNNINTFFYNNCNKNDTAFFNYIVLKTIGDTTQVCNFFGDKIFRVSQNGYQFYLVPDFYYDRNTHMPVMTGRNSFINKE